MNPRKELNLGFYRNKKLNQMKQYQKINKINCLKKKKCLILKQKRWSKNM